MKTADREQGQTAQRVKVGLIGLGLVLLLIWVAGIIFSAVRQDRPVAAAGGANADVVANMTDDNATDPDTANEPLADMGVSPSAAAVEDAPAPEPSPTSAAGQ